MFWRADVKPCLLTGSAAITFPRGDLNHSEKELNRVKRLIYLFFFFLFPQTMTHLYYREITQQPLYEIMFFFSRFQKMYPTHFCDAKTFRLVKPQVSYREKSLCIGSDNKIICFNKCRLWCSLCYYSTHIILLVVGIKWVKSSLQGVTDVSFGFLMGYVATSPLASISSTHYTIITYWPVK